MVQEIEVVEQLGAARYRDISLDFAAQAISFFGSGDFVRELVGFRPWGRAVHPSKSAGQEGGKRSIESSLITQNECAPAQSAKGHSARIEGQLYSETLFCSLA